MHTKGNRNMNIMKQMLYRSNNKTVAASLLLMASLSASHAAADPSAWQEITQLSDSKTHVEPSLWARLPKLKPKTTVTILDADGPGVVTMVHASALGKQFVSKESQGVLIRVFYDGESKPSINMPFMDFLGDIQCQSAYFNTVYFSKVRESHNLRLPMPFRKHIKIELENPSETNLVGSVDIQYEKVASLPENTAYLFADFREGTINAQEPTVLFEIDQRAKIVAHWLQYESEVSRRGETLCEADQMLYLDGDTAPTLNYLGTEDVYGISWGFMKGGIQSDNWSAIIRLEDLKPTGARVAMLRCRTTDAISFQKSCKWILTWANDPGHQKKLSEFAIPYRHCVYFYVPR